MKTFCERLLYFQTHISENLNCKVIITIEKGQLEIKVRPREEIGAPAYKTYIRRISIKEIRMMTPEEDRNLDEFIIEEAKYNLGIK